MNEYSIKIEIRKGQDHHGGRHTIRALNVEDAAAQLLDSYHVHESLNAGARILLDIKLVKEVAAHDRP